MKKSPLLMLLLTSIISHTVVAADYPMPASVAPLFEAPQTADPRPARYAVSLTGPNRIAVNGARIEHSVHDQTVLEVQADETNGQLFIFPRVEKESTLFLTTDTGQTHAVTVIPQSIASQNIVLPSAAPIVTKRERVVSHVPVLHATSLEVALKHLIRTMARGEVPAEFDYEERSVPLKDGTLLLKRYLSDAYTGEVIRYTNRSLPQVELEEKHFHEPGVLAVAIESRLLKKGETTLIYRVKRSMGDRL